MSRRVNGKAGNNVRKRMPHARKVRGGTHSFSWASAFKKMINRNREARGGT